MDDFLLIDTSTQIVQCGTVDLEGKIVDILRNSGDVIELLPNLVGKICQSGFVDKAGIIYCYGPGSTLGLRSALMAINVWNKFCGKRLKLYRYSSLSIAKYLAKNGVVVCGSSGKFISETMEGEIKSINSLEGFENFSFLNTRRVLPRVAQGMKLVDYDLTRFDDNFFKIAHEIEVPDLFEVEEQCFTKWLQKRHDGTDVCS
jgi:hypothetical protein